MTEIVSIDSGEKYLPTSAKFLEYLYQDDKKQLNGIIEKMQNIIPIFKTKIEEYAKQAGLTSFEKLKVEQWQKFIKKYRVPYPRLTDKKKYPLGKGTSEFLILLLIPVDQLEKLKNLYYAQTRKGVVAKWSGRVLDILLGDQLDPRTSSASTTSTSTSEQPQPSSSTSSAGE